MKILADEVNLGSQEQARGIEQIARTVTQMEQITQSTAAGAEERAASAEEMNAQAAGVRETVLQLNAMPGVSSAVAGFHRRAQANPSRSAAGKPTMSRTNLSVRKTTSAHKPAKRLENIHLPTPAPVNESEFPIEESFKEF